tara:strand:+ start:10058 stop:10384 length:327 start_codon:yes stop_codon:yes gene_type:complete
VIPWQLIGSLLSEGVAGLRNWFGKKADISEKKELARIENVSRGIPGYSDEYLVLIWSYPAIASFIPYLQPVVAKGIENFSALPEWYVGGFITISFSVFGIDKIFRWKK